MTQSITIKAPTQRDNYSVQIYPMAIAEKRLARNCLKMEFDTEMKII